jgi:hypothetical protein
MAVPGLRYILRIYALGPYPELEISEGEYREYESAHEVLSSCLAMEEKYEILISNYLDLEKELLAATAEYMVRHEFGYTTLFDLRLRLNIRLVNVLTSAKLYIDQLGQHVRDCLPECSDAVDAVKALFSSKYDAYKEYRFMEALRNYAQHRGIPVHSTSVGGRWTSLEESGSLEYSLEFGSLSRLLKEDPRFKKTVLEELPEQVDLKAATRQYVEAIGDVHMRNTLPMPGFISRALMSNTQLSCRARSQV